MKTTEHDPFGATVKSATTSKSEHGTLQPAATMLSESHTLPVLPKGADRTTTIRALLPGIGTLLLAVPVALIIGVVNSKIGSQPELALMALGVVFGMLLALPIGTYLVKCRQLVDPRVLGLIVLASVSVLLVGIYLYWVSFYVRFPADILSWTESDFVNDIIKFRVGYPIYSAQQNNDSFVYAPGPQLLTFFLAWLTGNATSIPAYRAIQVTFTILASIVAAICCLRLVQLAALGRRVGNYGLWAAFWVPFLFLVATNSMTNPFVYNLHDDSLAQLVTVVGYWLLLEYTRSRNQRLLWLMAMVPAVGFLTKQSLVIWAPLYCLYLFVFDRPRSFSRVAWFGLASLGGIALVVGTSYLLWGGPFIYWVFIVLGKHGISPLRSFQHVLDVWAYLAIGLLGGLALIRGKAINTLLGPWLVWLVIIFAEIWSSGIAWMINHIGPGSLIAGIWFAAAFSRVWSIRRPQYRGSADLRSWLRAGTSIACAALLFSGLGMVRIPLQPFGKAPYDYVQAIEKQFTSQPSAEVLLDFGSWIYLRDGVVMKDRAPTIGERGYSETGDFSAMIERIRQKYYAKILVREYHAADFWYDYGNWRQSSGIRQALEENYHEVGTIPAVAESSPTWQQTYGFTEISILVPNSP